MASVPVLTLVFCRGEFVYERQNQRDTIKLLFQVRFWILTVAGRNRGASEANVKSTALGLLELFANLIRVSIK
jgi:hypothetical protein